MSIRIASALLALSVIAVAQSGLSVSLSAEVAPVGTPITVTAQETLNLGLNTPGGALLSSVHSGSPTGPTVAIFPGTLLPVAVPQCGTGTRSQTWTPGTAVGPGTYWIEIITSIGPFGAFMFDYYCVTFEGPAPAAKLTEAAPPVGGTTYLLNITDGDPGALYLVAMSGTTNVGFPLGGGNHLCLDMDAIFALTFPSPSPAFFLNFAGGLDAVGAASGIGINLPVLQGACIPLCIQAVYFGGGTPGISTTNAHYFLLQ